MKRRFRIETGRYGGEIVCGTVSKEFVQYWKDKEERNVGVLAQQVEKVLPEVVSQDGNGYLNVDYGGIVPLLLEAIKELEARITYLENK